MARRLLSEDELGMTKRLALQSHLESCEPCRACQGASASVYAALQNLDAPQAPDCFRDIMARVKEEETMHFDRRSWLATSGALGAATAVLAVAFLVLRNDKTPSASAASETQEVVVSMFEAQQRRDADVLAFFEHSILDWRTSRGLDSGAVGFRDAKAQQGKASEVIELHWLELASLVPDAPQEWKVEAAQW